MEKCLKIIISGKVQGVFFRAGAKRNAQKLGISGWARNVVDGKVEILACGKEKDLKRLIEWCYNGTKGSVVKEVEVREEKCDEELDNFEILA